MNKSEVFENVGNSSESKQVVKEVSDVEPSVAAVINKSEVLETEEDNSKSKPVEKYENPSRKSIQMLNRMSLLF